MIQHRNREWWKCVLSFYPEGFKILTIRLSFSERIYILPRVATSPGDPFKQKSFASLILWPPVFIYNADKNSRFYSGALSNLTNLLLFPCYFSFLLTPFSYVGSFVILPQFWRLKTTNNLGGSRTRCKRTTLRRRHPGTWRPFLKTDSAAVGNVGHHSVPVARFVRRITPRNGGVDLGAQGRRQQGILRREWLSHPLHFGSYHFHSGSIALIWILKNICEMKHLVEMIYMWLVLVQSWQRNIPRIGDGLSGLSRRAMLVFAGRWGATSSFSAVIRRPSTNLMVVVAGTSRTSITYRSLWREVYVPLVSGCQRRDDGRP